MIKRELIEARIREWKRRATFTLGEWLVREISYEEYMMRKAIDEGQLAAAKEAAKDNGIWV